MLNRFRDFVKRLELPQEEEGGVVYRIIDDGLNAVEVTAAQYGIWRLQNDVTKRAIVGQDTVESVMVRTTFSIMPENRGYKPFGTSAYEVTTFDPLPQYSHRYDTWQEAERGHRNTLEQIRRDHATAMATERRADALAGTAGAVRLAVSAGIPAMFEVTVHSDDRVDVQTPLVRSDGTFVVVNVTEADDGFKLSGYAGLGISAAGELCGMLGLAAEGYSVTCVVVDEAELPKGILSVAQAAACISVSQQPKSGY